jgi:membrane associated rhomboid family serine protease
MHEQTATVMGGVDSNDSPGSTSFSKYRTYRADASPDVAREVHAAALQLKRQEFALVLAVLLALLLVAGVVTLIGGASPQVRGVVLLLGWAAVLIGSYGAKIAVDLVKLYRTDPIQTLRLEEQEDVERASEIEEHRERSALVRPFATYSLCALVSAVTAVEIYSGLPSIERAGLIKVAVRAGEWWRLLSASYLHAGLPHLVANVSSLRLLGGMVETYDRRTRVALVYLASAIVGNVASTFLLSANAVGASGGILGLAGYLAVVGARQPAGAPSWIRKRMLAILGTTALYGVVGFFFIDNAAHAGGALTGFLIGILTVPRSGHRWSARTDRAIDAVSWLSAAALVGGAAFTIRQLLGN